MLRAAARLSSRPCRSSPPSALLPLVTARLSSTGATIGTQTSIVDDAHLFPDHVLEEAKTGYPAGLPQVRDTELIKKGNEDILLAERAELWWDDGTAEPEWFVDRGSAGGANGGSPWVISDAGAVSQLFGAIGFSLVFFGTGAVILGDRYRPAAKRWEHGYPEGIGAQFGKGESEDEE